MDAPRGRYRVEEKDGRLVVIDTVTGAPASSSSAAPRGPIVPGKPLVSGPIARPPAFFDRVGRQLLRLVVRRWDEQGRAIIAWEWGERGRIQRWDAALGPAQQRRLGRALLGFFAFPLLVLASIFGGGALAWPLMLVALPAAFWGVWSIQRLSRETGGSNPLGE